MPSADRRLEPRRKPRQVRAELTRERILTAAAHVFAEHGYAAGTTNRIAERARISIGSLYQYFPNKDAILAEILVQHIDRGTWTDADELDLSPGTLEATVRALVRDAVDDHRDDPRLLRVMIEEARSPRSCSTRSTGTGSCARPRFATSSSGTPTSAWATPTSPRRSSCSPWR
jgi:AcrR family transcriptional regulator